MAVKMHPSWLYDFGMNAPADLQENYSKGEIVGWLLDLCAVKS